MDTKNPITNLIIGIATFGLTMLVAGVKLYRRHRMASFVSGAQDDVPGEVGIGNEKPGLVPDIPDTAETHKPSYANESQKNQPLTFFLLLFAITIPYWVFGGKSLPIPVKLPVSALAALNPMIAALILSYRQSGSKGIKKLFGRAFDYKKIKNPIWYIPTLLLPLLVYALSYVVMRWAGKPLPDPEIPLLMIPVLMGASFFFGIGEELGWMGYAIDPLQNRWGALKAAIFLGIIWGLFHLIPDLQNHQTAEWILWQRFGTMLLRVLMVWIYNNTGKSVFSSILFHAANNLGWALFPNFGSHYDPFVTGVILLVLTGVVVLGWDAKTLTRYRFSTQGHDKR